MKSRGLKISGILVAMVALFAFAASVIASGGGGLWLMGGQDLHNNRHNPTEVKIGPDNVDELEVKWVFETAGDVSATPAVDGEYVYFPDWGGMLHKLNRETGESVWSRSIVEYTGLPGDLVRTTPAVHGDLLIFGDQGGRATVFFGYPGANAKIMAVDKHTGDLVWIVDADDHPASIITQSAVVHGNTAYVGVSSFEELAATFPGYPCCTFRGSVMALNAQTGEIIWKTYMVPEGPAIGDPDFPGFSGNAVWGSTPVVDTKRGTLYIATGNNYTAPQSVLDCVEDNDGDPDAIRDCFAINYPDNYFDAIVALDIGSGEVKWGTPVIAFDSWNVACFPFPGLPSNPENCPEPTGPDHDFGQGPALYTVKGPNMPRDLIGAGQKSGQYWTLDPDSGEVVWVSLIGPGGELGGLQWGSATDGEMVYSAVANSNAEEWILQAGPNVGQAVYGGLWSAADAATGEIIWQTADPGIGGAQAAVTLANGVLYGCSMFPGQFGDNMHALDSSTGEILWSFASVGSCNAGAAVVNGTVYWGSGYGAFGVPGDNKFYAFSVPDIE